MNAAAAIQFPWPPKELSPNARSHFHAKARIAKAYREQAYWISRIDPLTLPADGEIPLLVEFFPPDARKRDLDNMLSSAKAMLDGFSDAHVVNDQRFTLTIRRCEPTPKGKVIVRLAA